MTSSTRYCPAAPISIPTPNSSADDSGSRVFVEYVWVSPFCRLADWCVLFAFDSISESSARRSLRTLLHYVFPLRANGIQRHVLRQARLRGLQLQYVSMMPRLQQL